MNKREEIREGVAILASKCGYRRAVSLNNCDGCVLFDEENGLCKDKTADKILDYLQSKGVAHLK